jgi:putative hydrolase of the HAD superfamily
VYLLSNTRQEWFEFLDAKFGITRRVKQAYLSYEIGYAKPDARCYNAVVSAIGCPPSDLVFIDDRVGNVVAARELGITSILFKNAQTVESKLRELYPELFPSRDIGSVPKTAA